MRWSFVYCHDPKCFNWTTVLDFGVACKLRSTFFTIHGWWNMTWKRCRERERERERERKKREDTRHHKSIGFAVFYFKKVVFQLGKEDSKNPCLLWLLPSLVSIPDLSQEGSQGISWEFHQGGFRSRSQGGFVNLPKAKGWLQMAGIGISCLRSFLPWGW